MDCRTAISVFVKFPEEGRVKTRLARTIGNKDATAAYERMVKFVIDRVLTPLPSDEFAITLCCDPFRPLMDYQNYFQSSVFSFECQTGGTLGTRLTHAFQRRLESHKSALAIGTDCVELRPSDLTHCRRLLNEKTDVVLGPAQDGGYYLIGAKSMLPSLFVNIPWSSDRVFKVTQAHAVSLGLRVTCLPVLRDVDTHLDLLAAGPDFQL